MLFTLRFLQETFPVYKGTLNEKLEINEMMTDSRKKHSQGLFIPIIGEHFDAHDFIHEAIKNGAVATLWDETVPIPSDVSTSIVFFLVKDTTAALQHLAKSYLQKVHPIVIGITGSNGKTTTKDLLMAVLQTKYNTHATIGNLNNHIGLPLTILQMTKKTEILILEMGMSNFNEIDLLTKIAEPTFAIITNIGESHIEYLGSREGIAKAKLEIRNGLQQDGFLVIDGDETLLANIHDDPNVIACGFENENDVFVSHVQLRKEETTFKVGNSDFSVPLLGKHHAKNASFVIIVAKKLGLDETEIQRGLQSLELSNMRFEWLKGVNNVSIINDAYNASPTSMKAAIEVLKQLEGFERKIVVLGDVLELGTYSSAFHRSIADVIDAPIDSVYTFGNDSKFISDTVRDQKDFIEAKHFTTKKMLIDTLQNKSDEKTVILFKASRGMAFEQIVNELL